MDGFGSTSDNAMMLLCQTRFSCYGMNKSIDTRSENFRDVILNITNYKLNLHLEIFFLSCHQEVTLFMYYNKEYKESRGKKTKEGPKHLGSLFTEKVRVGPRRDWLYGCRSNK